MTVGEIDDVLALSPMQLGLFSHASLLDDDAEDPYVISMTAEVTGPLDVSLLRDCASQMLIRHPNLRVSFWSQDIPHPVQVVPSLVTLPWRHVRADNSQAASFESAERNERFDLRNGPLIRFLLIELPCQRWHLIVTAHHIVIDGWSLPVFISEMLALYREGGNLACLPPTRPYRDYIGWLADRDVVAAEKLWRNHLSGIGRPTLLSPALGGHGGGAPTRTEIVFDDIEAERLAAGARSRGVTLNTLLQLAWALVLARLTDSDEVVFGVTVSGRPPELSGVESMVGLFINTIPLRVTLDPKISVAQLSTVVQREAATLRDHSFLTHAQLRTLAGVGEMFDTLLVYESFPAVDIVGGQPFVAGDVIFHPAAMESLTHFPVTIAAHRMGLGLTIIVEVAGNALGSMTSEVLGQRIVCMLGRLLDGWHRPIAQLGVLLDHESNLVVTARSRVAEFGLVDRFVQIAEKHRESTALSWSTGQLSYADLHERSDRLAGLLVDLGVRHEVPVAIRLPRSADYVIAILGVLKAGGMYVPLDPTMPTGRVESILAQTGATIIIGEDTIAAAEFSRRHCARIQGDQAAYAVFTSGTTGEPKGVIGTHRALLSYVDDHAERILRPAANRLNRRLVIGHAWSFAFDAAWQPLAGLLYGHTVHLIDEMDRRDAEVLVEIIAQHGIDMLDVTPSLFTNLRRAGLLDARQSGTDGLTVLALGGEAVGMADWADIRKACIDGRLVAHNCYGPTETTVEAVVAAIAEHDVPVIGYPTTGTSYSVLDSWLQPVPDGLVGELYLGGDQVTRGYVGRAGETAARFVAAAGGIRMYRTGDLVRRGRDGALSFIGRADTQIQVRGYRVEPAEITAVFAAVRGVLDVHVAVRHEAAGPRIVAYVVGDVRLRELSSAARDRLPRYMRPHRIVAVDAIPLTANGKVDDAALARSAQSDDSVEQSHTPTERTLVQVVEELLNISQIDLDAGLFDLGLDSISALSLVQAARHNGLGLRARWVLECDSLRELAAAVDREGSLGETVGSEPAGPIPATPAVHWLYEFGDPRRLAQTEAIEVPIGITRERLRLQLDVISASHEIFRSRLDRATMTFHVDEHAAIPLTEVEVRGDLRQAVTEYGGAAIERLDPERGLLCEALWLHPPEEPGVLVIVAHVLAVDPGSWRIVLGELAVGFTREDIEPGFGEFTSYRRWAHQLVARARELDTVGFWLHQIDGADPTLGARRIDPVTDRAGDVLISVIQTPADVTSALLGARVPIQHILADACAQLITRWRQEQGHDQAVPLVALETHGRDEADDTVGLLSAIYPLRIRPGQYEAEMPGLPIDYALLRYLRADTAGQLRQHREPQMLLNYVGRIDVGAANQRCLLTGLAPSPEPNAAIRHEVTVIAAVVGDGLLTQWRTLPSIFTSADVTALQAIWQEILREIAEAGS